MSWRAAAALLVFSSALLHAQDSKLCATCHADIARTYAKTGMARSFSRVSAVDSVQDFHHAASDTHYSMSNGHQRRWIVGFDGKPDAIEELPAEYVIGSGNHAKTFLSRTSRGTLIELPLGWYAENGGTWGMNPGYDAPHPPPHRSVPDECLFCHNGYPKNGQLSEGIGCERCHGDGSEHATSGKPILNPARLSKDRQMEVCMQCHLETTSTRLPGLVRLFNREPFSYKPGEPLGDFILSFDHASGAGYDDKFEVAGGAYRLRKSKCFLESKGELTCTTCHNPHDVPRGAEAARVYSAACRNCHAVTSAAHLAVTECISCHMPKRRTDDAVHVVMTDHLIQRPLANPAALLTPNAEKHPTAAEEYHGPVIPYYPALFPQTPDAKLAAAVAMGIPALKTELSRPGPNRAEGYLALGDAYRNEHQLANAAAAYAKAVDISPQCERCLRMLGTPEALRRAIELKPDDAEALSALGQIDHDVPMLQKAAALAPEQADIHNALAVTLLANGKTKEGESAFREAIRADPSYAGAHANLARLLAETSRVEEALFHYARAASLEPMWAANLFDYAATLVRVNKLDQAQQQVEAALRADEKLPEAHELLGGLLLRNKQAAAALTHFEAAVRLKPDFSRAHFDLGITLAAMGRREEAITRLREAAKATDPQVANAAREALRQLATSEK